MRYDASTPRAPTGRSAPPWRGDDARLAEGRYGEENGFCSTSSSIPGNGLGAFNIPPINIRVEGGAQDGVGKGARGGKIVILKGENRNGLRVGGAVGKGLAYGAQGGTFLIQGDADSRACIRLSGADVVLGGRIRRPLADDQGHLAAGANLKGFAFEYMTAGRAVVLGDPGPWLCSGMTGGTVYCHLDTGMGLTREALRRRLARGAEVEIRDLEEEDVNDVGELLLQYHRELFHSHQIEEADWVEQVLAACRTRFVKIVPEWQRSPRIPGDSATQNQITCDSLKSVLFLVFSASVE
jgi:glutamate synthase (NADPH/NADH) large chain